MVLKLDLFFTRISWPSFAVSIYCYMSLLEWGKIRNSVFTFKFEMSIRCPSGMLGRMYNPGVQEKEPLNML